MLACLLNGGEFWKMQGVSNVVRIQESGSGYNKRYVRQPLGVVHAFLFEASVTRLVYRFSFPIPIV